MSKEWMEWKPVPWVNYRTERKNNGQAPLQLKLNKLWNRNNLKNTERNETCIGQKFQHFNRWKGAAVSRG